MDAFLYIVWIQKSKKEKINYWFFNLQWKIRKKKRIKFQNPTEKVRRFLFIFVLNFNFFPENLPRKSQPRCWLSSSCCRRGKNREYSRMAYTNRGACKATTTRTKSESCRFGKSSFSSSSFFYSYRNQWRRLLRFCCCWCCCWTRRRSRTMKVFLWFGWVRD